MEIPSDKLKKRSRIRHSGVDGLLGGIDVGAFPLHDFYYNCNPEPLNHWPLRLLFGGHDQWRDGCYRYRVDSGVFAIEIVDSGFLYFHQGQRVYRVDAGNIFIVHRHMDSEIYCKGCGAAKKRTVCMGGALLASMLAALGLDKLDVMKAPPADKLDPVLNRIFQVLRMGDAALESEGAGAAYELLLLLAGQTEDVLIPYKLKDILRFFDEHLDSRISIEDLCDRFSISSSSLHRLFNKYMDDTPVNYFIKRKMDSAKQMLKISELSVKDITYRLGYSNPFHFSAEFKKCTGKSPTEYRRSEKDAQ
jgi:AraC-like DNA-binding protein